MSKHQEYVIGVLNRKIQYYIKDYSDLFSKHQQLLFQVERLTKTNANLTEELKVSKEVNKINTKLSLQNEETYQTTKTQLRTQNQNLKSENDRLQKVLNSVNVNEKSLQYRLSVLTESSKTDQTKLQLEKEMNKKLESKLQTTEEALVFQKEFVAISTTENDDLRKKIIDYQNEIFKLQQNCTKLIDEKRALAITINKLQSHPINQFKNVIKDLDRCNLELNTKNNNLIKLIEDLQNEITQLKQPNKNLATPEMTNHVMKTQIMTIQGEINRIKNILISHGIPKK